MKNNEVINSLIREIHGSGKKFKDIPKKNIIDYISYCGIANEKDINSIYNYILNYYDEKKSDKLDKSNDNFKDNSKVVMEDINISNNEVKQRTPRKSIFSEIKKI